MTSENFCSWLEGYLHNKTYLYCHDIQLIQSKLRELNKGCKKIRGVDIKGPIFHDDVIPQFHEVKPSIIEPNINPNQPWINCGYKETDD